LVHKAPPSRFGRPCGADSKAHAKKASKHCFFDKKKQKTLAILLPPSASATPNSQKFFASFF
jgi:hypothetical protein